MRKYFLTHSMRTALPQYQIRQDIIGKEIMDWCLSWTAAAAAKSLQSCPTLCNPRDGSPPDSPVPGILQARTLEWVAIYEHGCTNPKKKKKKEMSKSNSITYRCAIISTGICSGTHCRYQNLWIFKSLV